MKIIHTSDWHLGHTLYEHDRTVEHEAFLKQLRDIVEEERPDALLVSGDIYDRTNPSTSVQKVYYKALLGMHSVCPEMAVVVTAGNHDSKAMLELGRELWLMAGVRVIGLYYKALLGMHSVCPEMAVVVTAGNHDSKAMLELGRELWLMAGVRVIGQLEKKDGTVDLDRHIIGIKDDGGVTKGYVVAVPHIFDQNYPLMDEDCPKDKRRCEFFKALQERVKDINTDGLPVVMMAHMTVANCNFEGQEADTVGGIGEVSQEELGTGYDYIALGHIHYPQTLKGSDGVARYSGSPVPVSFDETYPHSVSVVTVERGREPEIREIKIKNVRPMLTVPAVPSAFQEALKALQERVKDINTDGLPVVMMAHMTVANCNFEGQEADTVGGIGEVSQEELGTGYDYIALGHIHYPQTLKGSDGVARYSGSPVPVSFDETYPHSVSVVTVERGREPEIREIKIKNVRPMLTVPAVPSAFQEALDGLSAIGGDEECYVRLNILLKEPMPADYMERIAGALEGKRAAYCYCKTGRKACGVLLLQDYQAGGGGCGGCYGCDL